MNLFSTWRVQTADGLAQVPTGYGDIPALGPLLPGDLGHPILTAASSCPCGHVLPRWAQNRKNSAGCRIFGRSLTLAVGQNP